MNKFVAALAVAAIVSTAHSPAFATDRGHIVKPVASSMVRSGPQRIGKFGKIAIGLAVGAGIASALIASRSEAATPYRSYQPEDGGMCRVWRADCRKGFEGACRKYERTC